MAKPAPAIDEIVRDCLAVRVRLIGRAVTAIYEREVSGHGVTIAQVNVMAALGKMGPCSPARIGQVLQLERSTVSRNLDLLIKNHWVDVISSNAKGAREVAITQAGVQKIESIMVAWRAAQREAIHLLGDQGVLAVRNLADAVWADAKT